MKSPRARSPSATQPSPAGCEHLVQLFDASRSLADAVARFLYQGWEAGEQLLVIAKPRHWSLIAGYLERHGCAALDPASRDRLAVFDATEMLRKMRERGALSVPRGRTLITTAVEQQLAFGRPLRVYGELVELLAEEGNFEGSCAIEDVWNDLGRRHSFRLLCGYSAAHFADPGKAAALRAICDRHSRVQTHSADSLGSWLTNSLL